MGLAFLRGNSGKFLGGPLDSKVKGPFQRENLNIFQEFLGGKGLEGILGWNPFTNNFWAYQ